MEETTSTTTSLEPQTERREWVTPAFEQVELKEALGGGGKGSTADTSTYSS